MNVSPRLRRTLILSTCLTAGLVLPSLALADDATAAQPPAPPPGTVASGAPAPGGTVGEIIVTAERRAVNLQKSPLAITAIPARQLDQSFINNVAGLSAQVPSLEVTKASGFENLITIRGVGSETPENSLTTVPGVSEFIDGVYIANTISLDQTLFNVADVQVLRGPQGALYGESSIGGAILINTVQPQLNVFNGHADASFGNYDLYRLRAETNIPVGDTVAIMLAGQKYSHAGFTQDAAIPGFSLDDLNDVSGEASILWRPTDTFRATFTAQGYYADQHGDAQKNINDPSPNPWIVYQDYPAHFRLSTQLYHLNMEWDLPWFQLRSVTGYQILDHVQREDSSRSSVALIGEYDDVAAWNTSVNSVNEEFDVLSLPGSRLQWIGGVFYMHQNSHQFVAEFECLSPGPQAPCAEPTPASLAIPPNIEVPGAQPPNLAYGNDSHAVHESYAIFGQATYPVTENLRITGGVRYNYDYDEDPSYNFAGIAGGGPSNSFSDNKATSREPTWRVEGDYDVTRDSMLYLSAARGYKPGGANGSNGQLVVPPTFKPETNTAFEFGSKNYLLDHTLRFNFAAFYYIHDDFQYIETDPRPFEGGISNIPRVDDYGAEFEGNYVTPDTHLHIDGSLALERGMVVGNYRSIDSTIANRLEGPNFTGGYEENFATFQFGPCAFSGAYYNPACWAQVQSQAVNLNGKQPPDMPNFSGSVAASYRFDLPWGTLTPRVQLVYRGTEWARIFNDPALDKVPSYATTNVNIDFIPANTRIRLSLTGTNIFNVAGINSRYTDPYGTFTTSNQYIPPAQVIGTIAYSW